MALYIHLKSRNGLFTLENIEGVTMHISVRKPRNGITSFTAHVEDFKCFSRSGGNLLPHNRDLIMQVLPLLDYDLRYQEMRKIIIANISMIMTKKKYPNHLRDESQEIQALKDMLDQLKHDMWVYNMFDNDDLPF